MKDKRVSSTFKVNSSEYSIRYNPCIEKFVAHLEVKGVGLYVASAGRKDTLEDILEKEPQPKGSYNPEDTTQRFSVQQRSAINNINHGRELNKLPLLKIKIRQCMSCKGQFESIEKRICANCRGTVDFQQTSSMSGRDIS